MENKRDRLYCASKTSLPFQIILTFALNGIFQEIMNQNINTDSSKDVFLFSLTEIFPRDLRMKDKFLNHLTGKPNFTSELLPQL